MPLPLARTPPLPPGSALLCPPLLAAVNEIVGVVEVQHDAWRRRFVAAAEQVDEVVEDLDVCYALQRQDGRLARWSAGVASRPPLSGARPHGGPQRRMVAGSVKVVGALGAAGKGHHARGNHVRVGVRDQQAYASESDDA